MVDIISASEKPWGVRGMGESALTTRKLEKVGEPERTERMGKPASAVDKPEKARKPERLGKHGEARELEEAREPEITRELGGIRKTEKPVPTSRELENVEETEELEPAIGEPEEVRGLRKPVTLLLFWSDCLQALALVATCFSC